MDENIFGAYFEERKRREAKQTAAALSLNPATPDETAQHLDIAKRAGVPVGPVKAAPELFRQRIERETAAKALEKAPRIAEWLRADPDNGALAKDDVENLTWWEQLIAAPVKGMLETEAALNDSQIGRGVRSGVTGGKQMGVAAATVPIAGVQAGLLNRLDLYDRAADIDPASPRHVIAETLGIDPMSQEAGLVADFVAGDETRRKWHIDRAARMVTSNKELMGTLVERVREYEAHLKTTQGRAPNFTDIEDVKGFGDWLGFNLGQAAPYLLATMGAGVVAGPAGVAASGYAMGVGDIRSEQITAGQDPFDPTANAAAIVGGVPYAALEMIGPAAAPFRGVSPQVLANVAQGFFRRAARDVPQNVIEEFINEAGQEIIKDFAVQAGGGADVVLNDETLLKWFNAGMAGAASGGAISPAATALSVANDRRARTAQQAGQTASRLDTISAQAQASQLRARSPERFKDALDRAGLGDSEIYVPAAGLREFFQAKDAAFDDGTLRAWGIEPDTFAEMEAAGGQVSIPLSSFATYIAGTDAEAWVRENATMDPDEMSISDAALFNEQWRDVMAAEFEAAEAERRADEAAQASDVQVYDGLYSQLRAAGQGVDAARTNAAIASSFYRTMADRTGDDALELARRFGVRIQGPQGRVEERRRGTLDVLINEVRAGKREKPGRTLTEFVRDAGGVQDTGGDVAALEVKGLVAETAGEIAARQSQPAMPGMMPAQGKGLALDELGRMAVEAGYFPELIGEVQGLNDGEAADLGAALLAGLQDEASGNLRYLDGEGPNEARAELAAELSARGLDPAAMSNDEIAAALQGREYGQAATVEVDGVRLPLNPDGTVTLYHGTTKAAAEGIIKTKTLRADAEPTVYLTTAQSSDGTGYGDGTVVAVDVRPDQLRIDDEFPDGRVDFAIDSPRARIVRARIVGRELNQSARKTADDLRQTAKDAGVELSISEGGGYLTVSRIVAQERNQGAGSRVMQAVVDYADATGQTVALTPSADFGGSVTRLRQFYKRFGFVENKGRNKDYGTRETMLREPGRSYKQERRGSIVFPAAGPEAGETVINLFETADLSTALHEFGHLFLETYATIAADEAAPAQVRDDMAAIRAYLKADDGHPFTVEQHETFARSLEAYVVEGKSPSLALADVFARVKSWLVRIYRSALALDVKITPEIREVFDRMLATDAEIAQQRAEIAAGPLFREAPAGMSATDWATYQRMSRRSAEEAEAKLRDKTMARIRREREAWWKAERAEVRKEVAAMLNAQPRFRLIEAMANGRWLDEDGTTRDAPDMQIDRKMLVEQFGDGVLSELQRSRFGGKRAIYGDGTGLSPAAAAEMFGFDSPAQMVEALQNSRKRADEIEAQADRVMLERYGDPMTDGSIEAEALEAIHNEQQERAMVAEARHMASQMGRDTRGMTAKLYRQRARLMIGRMTVREASAPAKFLASERRAGQTAQQAFAKVARGDAGSMAAALQAKEQQVLNAMLYDEARKVEAEVARVRERMQAFGKKSVREKLEGGYIEQIDDILDRYDFRQRGPGAVRKSESLAAFVDRMIAEGREAELAISPAMLDEARRVHYTRLSVDDLRALVDTVDNIDHLGRFKQKLINQRRQRDLAQSAERVATNIENNIAVGRAKGESRVRSALDLLFTADTVMIDIDGGDEFGAAYQEIKEDIDHGATEEARMSRELAEKLDTLFKAHFTPKQIAAMKVERAIPGVSSKLWSRWKAIAVALNTGNEDNLARLLSEDAHASERLDQAQLDAVLNTLDKNEWDFVQGMWDLINGYWPDIAEVTKRRTGVAPQKVEARAVQTKHGTYAGGYYPIKYDAGLGVAAAMDARTAEGIFHSAGRHAKAATKSGHTIERKKTGNGRTLRLEMDVAFTHLRDVVRDIALSEAVDNAHRVINHPRVAQAFIEAGRANDHQMLNLWLKDVARGPIVHSDLVNQFARILKSNFTLSRLALNFKTAALQLTGIGQSAVTVGKANMLRAMMDYRKRPGEVVADIIGKSEFMRGRQGTFDKDIHDFANDAKITGPMANRYGQTMQFLSKVGFAPLTKVQFYAVDVPTWLAGYRVGLQRFPTDEARAVQYADRMVARAQDSGLMPDRSAISRGTTSETTRQVEFIKLFTTLGGYMIAKLNRGYVTGRQGVASIRDAQSSTQRLAAIVGLTADMMLIYVSEAAMMALAYAALVGLDDDEELEAGKLGEFMLKEVGGAVIGGVPVVRDAASAFSEFGDAGGVYGSALEIPAQLWKQTMQGENDRGWRRAFADAVGTATGLPSTATMRVVEEAFASDDGPSMAEMLMGRNPLIER